MGVNATAAEGVCQFHADLKEQVKKHDEEIVEIKERLATGDEKLKALGEIKESINWANRLTIGTLITVVITLATIVFKLKGG